MIEGRDFIITSIQPWNITIGYNAKDIASEISKNNRVLYINTYCNDAVEYKVSKIDNNLWSLDIPVKSLPINFLPDGFPFDLVNLYNQKRVVKYIKRAIKELNFSDYFLFIDNDIYKSYYLPDLIKPQLSIYYRRDKMVSAYWSRHTPRLEPLLIGKCNCVTANSLELANGVREYNNIVEDVGQGVNLEAYMSDCNYPQLKDLSAIPSPIIGYTGMLTSLRLDADLMFNVAKRLQNCNFVFVGAEDDVFKNHKLHTLSNVFFLGGKTPELMPNYISYFDVCLNPQIINEITIGNYPRKVDEYLAMGKPVIATSTDTMKSVFGSMVTLADSVDEYVDGINKELSVIQQKDVVQRRIDFANSHSWTNSVNKIYETIEKANKYYVEGKS